MGSPSRVIYLKLSRVTYISWQRVLCLANPKDIIDPFAEFLESNLVSNFGKKECIRFKKISLVK